MYNLHREYWLTSGAVLTPQFLLLMKEVLFLGTGCFVFTLILRILCVLFLKGIWHQNTPILVMIKKLNYSLNLQYSFQDNALKLLHIAEPNETPVWITQCGYTTGLIYY